MVSKITKSAAERKGTEDIAVISFNNLQVGAWSQIQMLCAQIGVDCFRAKDKNTLRLVLNEISNKRLVLIDTPGIEVHNQIKKMSELKIDFSRHLVLPADASGSTIKKFLEDPNLKWNSLMVSRMDEATQPWPLIKFLCEKNVNLSAASFSGNISEACQILTPSDLVNLAIKGLDIVNVNMKSNDIGLDQKVLSTSKALVTKRENKNYAI